MIDHSREAVLEEWKGQLEKEAVQLKMKRAQLHQEAKKAAAYGMMAVSALSFLLVAVLTPLLIWTLRKLRLTQPIRAELPADHQAKRGTPLMAGLILLIGVAASLQFHPAPRTLLLCMTFLLFSSIGFLDDFKKAFWQNPSGISSRTKLVLQFIFTGAILYVLLHS